MGLSLFLQPHWPQAHRLLHLPHPEGPARRDGLGGVVRQVGARVRQGCGPLRHRQEVSVCAHGKAGELRTRMMTTHGSHVERPLSTHRAPPVWDGVDLVCLETMMLNRVINDSFWR